MATTKSGHPARWVCVLLALSILAGLAACQPASKPAITSLSPTSGTVGTSVTIRGSRLNGVSAVRFNGVSARFSNATSTSVTAIVPSGATSGPISVSSAGGVAASPSPFIVKPHSIVSDASIQGAANAVVDVSVLTINACLNHCIKRRDSEGFTTRAVALDRIDDLLATKQPTVAGLQEVCSGYVDVDGLVIRWVPGHDERIANRHPEYEPFFVPSSERCDMAGGFLGILLLVRKDRLIQGSYWKREYGAQQTDPASNKWFQCARITSAGGPVQVCNTHLAVQRAYSRPQAEQLVSELPRGVATILTGDFNVPRDDMKNAGWTIAKDFEDFTIPNGDPKCGDPWVDTDTGEVKLPGTGAMHTFTKGLTGDQQPLTCVPLRKPDLWTDHPAMEFAVHRSIPVVPGNRPPATPDTLEPAPGAVVNTNQPTLRARSSDPDGDPLEYRFELHGPGVERSSEWQAQSSWTVPPFILTPGDHYAWSVQARDSKKATSAKRVATFAVALLPVSNEIVSTPSGLGYWMVQSDGGVFSFGDAGFHGSLPGIGIAVSNIVGMTRTPSGQGYWLVGADGGVFAFGDAGFHGSLAGQALTKPIVAMAPTKTGGGYWLVGADGGVFSFGDASFFGSMGASALNADIVSIAPSVTGQGYWLAAKDGGVFSFGDAPFYGSLGSTALNWPVTDFVPSPSGRGYWLAAEDGGVFTFGDAGFFGALAGRPLNGHITSITSTVSGQGYWLAGCDGGVFAFGDARFHGAAPDKQCRGIS